MDKQEFGIFLSVGEQANEREPELLSVKEWMASIEAGETPDRLTVLDDNMDKSIGGLGTTVEYLPGTKYAVPLFEFRELGGIDVMSMEVDGKTLDGFESFVAGVEESLEDIYDEIKDANPGMRVRRRATPTTGLAYFTVTTPTPTPNEPAIAQRDSTPSQKYRLTVHYNDGNTAECASWETTCEGFVQQNGPVPALNISVNWPSLNVGTMVPVDTQTHSTAVSEYILSYCPTATAPGHTPTC